MAKNDKGAAKPAAKDTKTKPAKDAGEFKYGVADLAEHMDIKPESVRVGLRKHEVPRLNGNSYGWKTKEDLKAVADKLRSGEKVEKAKPKVKAAGTESKAKPKAVPKKKAA